MTMLRRLPITLTLSLAWASPAWASPPDEAVDAPADAPSDAPTDAPSEAPTDAPLEGPTDAPSEAPLEGPTEAPSDAPAQPQTEPAQPVGDPPPPPAPSAIGDKHSIQYSSLLAPRVNPLGLEERLWIGYQYRLYDKDKKILNGSNLGIFFRPIVNPAIVLVGPTVQVQPAAILRLRATYAYVQYLGSFQFMQSYQSPYDDYSETRLDEQADAGQNYAAGGHEVELEAQFQIKVKSLAIRNTLTGVYSYFNNLRGDDDLFYSPRYDILVPAKGWLINNDTDVLWLQSIKGPRNATLIAGARATVLMPFFTDDMYEEGDVRENPVGPQVRVGPSIGYTFFDKPERRFNKPTLLVIPAWNVQHRWRSGRDVNAAYPTIVIAFAFSGQLWGKN